MQACILPLCRDAMNVYQGKELIRLGRELFLMQDCGTCGHRMACYCIIACPFIAVRNAIFFVQCLELLATYTYFIREKWKGIVLIRVGQWNRWNPIVLHAINLEIINTALQFLMWYVTTARQDMLGKKLHCYSMSLQFTCMVVLD